MKKVLFLMILLFLMVSGTATMKAQVKIGENTVPRKGAVLDLNGSYKGGLLLPHVEITDMGKIPNDFHDTSIAGEDEVLALAGLMVWNTGTGSEGVYVWDGKDWQAVAGGTTPPQECPAPATPGDITFDKTSIKVGETTTATCGAVDGATSYEWTLPADLTADPLTTTTNQLVITGTNVNDYASGSIKVITKNHCGESASAADNKIGLSVTTSTGKLFLGKSAVCLNSNKSACTCLAGIPVAWSSADDDMRQSVIASKPTWAWWVNDTPGDDNTRNWNSGWSTDNRLNGLMACF